MKSPIPPLETIKSSVVFGPGAPPTLGDPGAGAPKQMKGLLSKKMNIGQKFGKRKIST